MKTNHLTGKEWVERIILALLFVAMGSFIIIAFSPWGGNPMLGKSYDYLTKIGLSLLLLSTALMMRRNERFEKYWQIFFALFVLIVAVSLDRITGIYLFNYLDIKDNIPSGWALAKLNECFVVVSVVITFTLLSGGSLGSIYVHKGNLKPGLIIGGITFLIGAVGGIPTADLLFKGGGLTVARVLPWIPWVLIFVLANGALEELLFRGLFLRKLEPFFGKFISNFLVAIVFTVLHKGAFYTSDEYIFLAITFPLALAWGYLMQKTDSIWGSVLFHAGMDIPIILGILVNL